MVGKLDELVEVMKQLRGEKGCPWDREQTHQSLKPYLVEETYEVIDALDRNDDNDLKEELGDLLLQIVFHAQIASEENRFNIYDVAQSIVEKLKRRHPHVFSNISVKDSDEVLKNWEKIKKDEGKQSVLEGVPNGLPALLKARRVQEKAKRVGFDWENAEGAMEKVKEEIEEFSHVLKSGNKGKIEEEFGDILFSLVNVSRFLGIDAEESLRKTIDKFMQRFRRVEKIVKESGKRELKNYSLRELDRLWDEVKDEQES